MTDVERYYEYGSWSAEADPDVIYFSRNRSHIERDVANANSALRREHYSVAVREVVIAKSEWQKVEA